MSPFVKFEPPCGTPKSASLWPKFFLVYILMYWNGIKNLLSTFEKLFEIWSTLIYYVKGSTESKLLTHRELNQIKGQLRQFSKLKLESWNFILKDNEEILIQKSERDSILEI